MHFGVDSISSIRVKNGQDPFTLSKTMNPGYTDEFYEAEKRKEGWEEVKTHTSV